MSAALLLSDERLTRRAVDGDRRAFAAIFDRYQEPLYRFCLSIVGNRDDAQDAVQNTMVKALAALPGEERRIELRPWLYRIAHNESVELLRKRRPLAVLDPEQPGAGAGLAEEAEQRQRLGRLIADLGQLPERQRGALVMRELGGLGFEEIGFALGTSAATARQTLYEARLGLREMEAGREMRCEQVTRAISDGDGRVLRRRDIRAHLRGCEPCRAFRDDIEGRRRSFAALAPMPAVAAAAMLKGLLGGGNGGVGIGAALGAGAAKTVATSTVLKGVAAVAVVAAVGFTAAQRGAIVGSGGGGADASLTGPASEVASPGGATAGTVAAAGTKSAAAGAGGELRHATAIGAGTRPGAASPASATPEAASEQAPVPPGASAPTGTTQPPASFHGREAAAAHKGAAAARPPHPAHPVHPAHPAHPSHASHPPGAEPPAPLGHREHPLGSERPQKGDSEASSAVGRGAGGAAGDGEAEETP